MLHLWGKCRANCNAPRSTHSQTHQQTGANGLQPPATGDQPKANPRLYCLSWKNPPRRIRRITTLRLGIHPTLRNERRGSWRAGCAETCKSRFGGEGLVSLSNQDPASYPTHSAVNAGSPKQGYACMVTELSQYPRWACNGFRRSQSNAAHVIPIGG